MKKQDEEPFRMIATQIYIFLLGFCVGCAFVYPKYFWWVPLLDIALVIVARKLIHIADAKKNKEVQLRNERLQQNK